MVCSLPGFLPVSFALSYCTPASPLPARLPSLPQAGQLALTVRNAVEPSSSTLHPAAAAQPLASHYTFGTASLVCNSLEDLLERNGTALYLLDAETGESGWSQPMGWSCERCAVS